MVTGAVAGADLISTSENFIIEIGKIGSLLEALGIVVILWLIFEITAFIINRKRMKEVYKIKEDMLRIEKKLDRILKRNR